MSVELPPLPVGDVPKKKRANGCLIAVLAAILVGVLTFVVGGYYAMMYSGFPLSVFASSINSSGAARVDGLKGTLATGVKFDEFRVFKTGAGDSYIRDFSFKFNGMPDISGTASCIIDEFHVGRIYLSLPDGASGGGVPDPEIDPELKKEFRAQQGGVLKRFELKSFRIDEIVVQDAAGERTVGSMKLGGLVVENDALRLDAFELLSDHMEAGLESAPETNRFRQQIRGLVRTSLHTNVLRDLPFTILFGGATNAGAMRVEMFGGELIATVEKDGTSTAEFDKFSPGKWMGGFARTAPSGMSFSVAANRSGKRSKVTPGTLTLGAKTWRVPQQELDHEAHGGGRLLAETTSGDHTIAVQISDPAGAGGFRYHFKCEALAGEELLAHALFGRAKDELDDGQLEVFNDFLEPAGLAASELLSTPALR
ncbi:MAG: hypothetical protein ISQ14_00540 [Verrucomicrobiae bacterium]|nr:hypothetical protein [Verrucomicrobiae bacterium]